jgi:hypothetical protein
LKPGLRRLSACLSIEPQILLALAALGQQRVEGLDRQVDRLLRRFEFGLVLFAVAARRAAFFGAASLRFLAARRWPRPRAPGRRRR